MDPDQSLVLADATLCEDELNRTLTNNDQDITDQILRYINGQPLDVVLPSSEPDDSEKDELSFFISNITTQSRKSSIIRKSFNTSTKANSLDVTNLLRQFYDCTNNKIQHDNDLESLNLPIDLSSLSLSELEAASKQLLIEFIQLKREVVEKTASNFGKEMNRALDHLNALHSEQCKKLDSLNKQDQVPASDPLPCQLALDEKLNRILQLEKKVSVKEKELAENLAQLRLLSSSRDQRRRKDTQ